MKHFHWGRDISCFTSPPYQWSCVSDQLLMWRNKTPTLHIQYITHNVK